LGGILERNEEKEKTGFVVGNESQHKLVYTRGENSRKNGGNGEDGLIRGNRQKQSLAPRKISRKGGGFSVDEHDQELGGKAIQEERRETKGWTPK